MNRNLVIPIIALAAMSCKTNELYLNIVQPAPVTISKDIKTVGIIDRTTPSDETKTLDVIDKVLSLEGKDLDSLGTIESIKGVTEELTRNDRFEEVRLLSDLKFKTSNTGMFPSPLTWDQVEGICTTQGVNALFALEMYDTDTHVNYSTQPVQIKTPLGNIPGLEHLASMETIVKTGWRIYSPADNAILDEYVVAESVVFEGRGINPIAAASALLNWKDAVKDVSMKAGIIYARRLLPYNLNVTREYYVKGTDNFKIAKRKAQMGKWNEAAVLWEKETANLKMKIAGRATYNMAIINEINGDLEAALSWAQKSYENFRIKLGLRYSHIIENRMYDLNLLKIQEER